MKKCKYCQTEIDAKAKICPNCKKNQNKLPIWLRIILGIFLIIIVAAITSIGEDESKEEYATLEKFNQIKTGMTYEQVKEIMSYDGTLSTDVGPEDSYNFKIYYWYGEDGISNTTISFENGKVSAKAQVGLK